jgi:Flp pilus assembly protein TadB
VTATNGRGPAPKRKPRPYRDSALLYAAFGVIVILVAFFTGGHIYWAIAAAVGAFLIGTGWTWRNLRNRERSRP